MLGLEALVHNKGDFRREHKLPTSIRSYYTGKWQTNGMTYNFGGSYTISSSTTFTAKWTPIEYKIHYMIFGKELTPPSSESSKRTFTIERDTSFWIPTSMDSTWYKFDGWYQTASFMSEKHNTSDFKQMRGFTMGEITVYGRWKYVRNNTYTVTDDGVFKQPSDSISFQKLTGYTLAELKTKGYKTIHLREDLRHGKRMTVTSTCRFTMEQVKMLPESENGGWIIETGKPNVYTN